MFDILAYILLGIFALAGLVLTVLSFPGVWLIYISTFLVAWMGGFELISPMVLLVIFFICLMSTLVDNIIMAMGAQKLGGTGWGMTGAIIGGIVGLAVGNIVGMFVGPVMGATAFELLFAHKDFKQSFKAGIGSFIGLLVSIVLKIGINVGIIVYVVSIIT